MLHLHRRRTHYVIGAAGGHTAEMLALVNQLDKDIFQPRCYVVGDTDALGPSKAASAEQCVVTAVRVYHLLLLLHDLHPVLKTAQSLLCQEHKGKVWSVRSLPRSREVGQSYLTSMWTTLKATCAALSIVWQESPQLVRICCYCDTEWYLERVCSCLEYASGPAMCQARQANKLHS